MKKKKLYLILTIFLLVLFCTMVLLFIGCKDNLETQMNREMAKQVREQEEARAEEEEQLAIDKQVRQDEAEQLARDKAVDQMEREEWEEAEETVVVDEKENLIPNEPITYSGNLYNANGTEVILIVNFKTTEVTGPISLDSVDDYIDATINGKIDIDTFEVTSNYSGIWRLKETDEEFPFNGTITGKITKDLSTFNGIIHPDYSDVGVEFTATK